ncbi:MAG TPA: hypothetical protein VKP14_01975 [Gaiellaceae bacterium]|nr:hypothetical protein [Gaiellaceae bacterium]
MVAATPAAVERAFAHQGVLVSPVAKPPELCDRGAGVCTGVDIWGGKVVYLAPKGKPDFIVVLLPTAADARRIGAVQRRSGLGTANRGSTLLVYLRSTIRIARLRAALSTLH